MTNVTDIDTTQTHSFDGSRFKLLLTLLGCLAFAALGLYLINGEAEILYRFDISATLVGWITLIVFGLFGAIAAAQFFADATAMLTISPEGFHDRRMTDEMVPWSAVRSVDAFRMSGQKMVLAAIHPEAEAGLSLKRVARAMRETNARLGADGLVVSTQGLKTTHEEVLTLMSAYANAWGNAAVRNN